MAEDSYGWSQSSVESDVLPKRLVMGSPIRGKQSLIEGQEASRQVNGLRLAEV